MKVANLVYHYDINHEIPTGLGRRSWYCPRPWGSPLPPLRQLWRTFIWASKWGMWRAEFTDCPTFKVLIEEFNRRVTSIVADYNFVGFKENLQKEGRTNLFIAGSSNWRLKNNGEKKTDHPNFRIKRWKEINSSCWRPIVRKSWGNPWNTCSCGQPDFGREFGDVKVVYPIPQKSKVREWPARFWREWTNENHWATGSIDFHNFMNQNCLFWQDSGGVQEERLLREAGPCHAIQLNVVGTHRSGRNRRREASIATSSLTGRSRPNTRKMSQTSNPYGDGTACQQDL